MKSKLVPHVLSTPHSFVELGQHEHDMLRREIASLKKEIEDSQSRHVKLRSALADEIFKRQESIQLTKGVLREVERLQVDLDSYIHLYKLAHFSEPNAVIVSSMSCPGFTVPGISSTQAVGDVERSREADSRSINIKSPRVDLRRSNMSFPHCPQAPVDDNFTPRTGSPTKQKLLEEDSSKQAAANTESVSAAQGKWQIHGKSTEEQAEEDPDGSYSDYSDSSMDETEKLEAWKRTRTRI
jgi:hypothetical protein